MSKLHITLAENMSRFGTKNLTESNKRALRYLAEQTKEKTPVQNTDNKVNLDQNAGENLKNNKVGSEYSYVPAAAKGTAGKEVFDAYKEEMWVMVFTQLVAWGYYVSDAKKLGETTKNYVYYYIRPDENTQYPFCANFKNLTMPAGLIKQSSDLFNKRYWAMFNKLISDQAWVAYFQDQFNKLFGSSVASPSDKVKQIQAYIQAQITDKKYVQNNGTAGKPFADGIWGPVSARAWLMFSKSILPSMTLAALAAKLSTTSKNGKTVSVALDKPIGSPNPAPAKTAVNNKPTTSNGGPDPSTFGKANTLD